VRCVIITGAGRGFCAGANLQPAAGERADAGMLLETVFHPFLRRLRELAVPLVTAVNGAAAGVGMSFALMGDLVLCGRSAYFLQAFRRIGLVPDGGSTWLLPRLIGKARATELSLLGERLPADKALEWGLVNRVFADDELMEKAREMGRELASGPTVALGLIRQLYWESPDNTYEQQLNLERQMQRKAGASADFKEGVQAFRQKRPAKFKGA
jgi:2-(1,2-epoxy-1,2-dihydrophenyl)acetyl-CoA isomerase